MNIRKEGKLEVQMLHVTSLPLSLSSRLLIRQASYYKIFTLTKIYSNMQMNLHRVGMPTTCSTRPTLSALQAWVWVPLLEEVHDTCLLLPIS